MKEITRAYRKEIGKRIKRKREELKETQEAFSENVGISKQTIVNLENGLGSLKLEYLYQIANYCACDMGYLLGECDLSSYDNSFISKETGLNEKAIESLKNKEKYIKLSDDSDENFKAELLIDILNNFIISDDSPLYDIGVYKYHINNKREIESKPYFKAARKTFLKVHSETDLQKLTDLQNLFENFKKGISGIIKENETEKVFEEMLYYDISCAGAVMELNRARMIVSLDDFLKTF